MATVVLPLEVARAYTGGATSHEVAGTDIRALVGALEQRYPGIAARLARGFAVAIDGEIIQDWFIEEVGAHSDVRFLPAIEGG